MDVKIILVIFLTSVITVTEGLVDESRCDLTDPQLNSEIQQCLKTGEKFIKRYLSRIRRTGQPGLCNKFDSFQGCLKPLLSKCPNLPNDVGVNWVTIFNQIECTCNGDQGCQDEMKCFEEEYDSILCRRCDVFHKFNRKQRTRHACTFLHENIHCKDALLTSSCGTNIGDFAFEIFKIEERKVTLKNRCLINRDSEYDGFRYNDKCPTNLTKNLQECITDSIQERQLEFHKKFDLLADARPNFITQACRDFKKYRSCARKVQKSCPRGTQLIYEYEGKLRTYALKLNYICMDQEGYKRRLPCYKEVLRNGTLGDCNHIWDELQPALDSVSPYEFYCAKNGTGPQALERTLADLRHCYKQVFSTGCGSEESSVLANLMSMAFKDPYYLRYMYKPDCNLHKSRPHIDALYHLPTSKNTSSHHHQHKPTVPYEEENSSRRPSGGDSHPTPTVKTPSGGTFVTDSDYEFENDDDDFYVDEISDIDEYNDSSKDSDLLTKSPNTNEHNNIVKSEAVYYNSSTTRYSTHFNLWVGFLTIHLYFLN